MHALAPRTIGYIDIGSVGTSQGSVQRCRSSQCDIKITTTNLPAGIVGHPYSGSIGVNGGTAPIIWSVLGGLPSGLALNSLTGEISGTPSTPGTFSFTVKVQDSSTYILLPNLQHLTNDQATVSITINPAGGGVSTPWCTISGPSIIALNTPFTVHWSNSGDVTSLISSGWSGPIEPPLPGGGLPANSAWGGIRLTATAPASVTITARNAANKENTCSYSVLPGN